MMVMITCCQLGNLTDHQQALLQGVPLVCWLFVVDVLHSLEEDLEQHNGGCIIEEALALHDYNQVLWRSSCMQQKSTRSGNMCSVLQAIHLQYQQACSNVR